MKILFEVTSVGRNEFHPEGYTVIMRRLIEGFGEIQIHGMTPDQFTVGKEYYVDFTPAEPPTVLT